MHGRLIVVPGGTTQPLCGGDILVAGFGRYYAGETEPDWTFRNLQSQADAEKDSALTRYLPAIAEQLGVDTILAPSPVDFNGRMCKEEELINEIRLGSLLVKRGVRADGCLLDRPGKAFAISTGACGVATAWHTNPQTHTLTRVGAAHAGLVSILNGVGSNLLNALEESPSDVNVDVEHNISADLLRYQWHYPGDEFLNETLCRFTHDWYGPECVPLWHHEQERREGRLHTYNMLRKQFMWAGVPYARITEGHPVHTGGRMYHTRDGTNKRNLIIVARVR